MGRKRKRARQDGVRPITDIAGAEKKLRQATFFLGHLEHPPREVVITPHDSEPLEFYVSACLTAAQSVCYVLQETGGATFQEVQRRWRAALPEPERSLFGRMMGLRDNDVHNAKMDAEHLHKYVKTKPHLYTACIGGNDAVVERRNPDGTMVSGSVLRGAVSLYIGHQGRQIEMTDACREFIARLTSLVSEMQAAPRRDDTGRSTA